MSQEAPTPPPSLPGSICKYWARLAVVPAALLVFVHLPVELAYRYPAVSLYLTPAQILLDTGLLVLIYTAVSALFAIPLALLAGPLGAWRRGAGESVVALSALMCVALMGFKLAPFAQIWWRDLLASIGPLQRVPHLGAALVVVLGGLVLYRVGRRGPVRVGQRLAAQVAGSAGLLLAVIGLALLTTLISGHLSLRPFGWRADSVPVATVPDRAPNVILIVIDTLAARDMSLYGHELPTTPRLDAFAERSTVFERFYAASNFTTPAVASMLTGQYPSSHGLQQLDGRLVPPVQGQALPGLLRHAGYQTGAAIANLYAHPLQLGVGDGFDYLSEVLAWTPGRLLYQSIILENARILPALRDLWVGPILSRWSGTGSRDIPDAPQERPPEVVTDRALAFQDQARAPHFVWAHYWQPHAPYLPPRPFRGEFLPGPDLSTAADLYEVPGYIGVYDAATQQSGIDRVRLRYGEYIAFVDAEIGRYLDQLEARGLLDTSVVVITSDHGESFVEGWHGHGGPLLNEPQIRVPLIVRLPGQTRGRRVSEPAGHVDLLPTILELAGVPVPAWAVGRSLVPALSGEPLEPGPLAAMTLQSSSRFEAPGRGSLALIRGPHKLVHYLDDGCESLYRVDDAGNERRLVGPHDEQLIAGLRAELADLTGWTLGSGPETAGACEPLRFAPRAFQ